MAVKKQTPIHPGKILRRQYIDPLDITIVDLADHLKVSRKTISKIINEHGSITADMALRLSKVFKTKPELWLNFQQNYDLWKAKRQPTGWKSAKALVIGSVKSNMKEK